MAMVQNVDGAGTGLDADLLDGMSSETFMTIGDTNNFDTMIRPGTYKIAPGAVGAPTATETFALLVAGNGSYFSQIATSVTENKLYYRSYVGSWSAWKEFASATGSVATADKLTNPVTIALSGDSVGSVSFDGSHNVNIVTTVQNDSHTHDGRYYTEAEQDARFLPLHGTADNATKLDNIDSTQFLRKDISDTMAANLTVGGNLTVAGNVTSNGSITYLNTDILQVEDKNIEMGKVSNPTDATADGGGFTLLGTTNKTITWQNSDNRWHFNQGITAPLFVGTATNADKLDGHDSSEDNDAGTVVLRDGSGDISTRLFRSEYSSTNASIGFIMTQVDTNNNNYIRPSTPAQLRAAMNVEDGATADMTPAQILAAIKTVDGSGSGLDADLLDGHNSSVSAVANTVVVRDSSGKVASTATSAQYADLAELYTTKESYDVGTLVQISTSDLYDIEKNVNDAFGVISDKPGFVLDDGIEGLPVAMVGKTPVKVVGAIKKGDKITSYGSVAIKAKEDDKIIGIALENKYTEEVELIRCFVQVQL
jgi:hypothetical protein